MVNTRALRRASQSRGIMWSRPTAALLAYILLGGAIPLAAGSIEGTIQPADRVESVSAVQRVPRQIFTLENRRFAGTFDPATGRYVVPDLPPGKYDLEVRTKAGTIEGVDLRLARERPPFYDLVLPDGPLYVTGAELIPDLDGNEYENEEERDEAVRTHFRIGSLLKRFESTLEVEQFTDKVRGLFAHGNMEEAQVLVILARTVPFHDERGSEVIWRVEVWPFRWYYGGWAKERLYVIDRVRLPGAEYRKMARFFDPRLGGIVVGEQQSIRLDYSLPDVLDSRMGKMAGEEF